MVVGAGARRIGLRVGICCLVAAACSGDDGEVGTPAPAASAVTSSTAPPRPTTTTSLVYDPATVEGQVEAAYLRSWEVYAAAVYDLVLDEEALTSVYAEPYLSTVRQHIQEKIDAKRPSLLRVDRAIEVTIVEPTSAVVLDRFVNHHVLLDPASRQPMEADPNEELVNVGYMQKVGELWLLSRVESVE